MSRRANGEGSVHFQRSRNRYRGRVTLPDGRRKEVYGKTREECSEKLTALLSSVHGGLPIPSGVQTVGDYLDAWIAQHRGKVRHTTGARYADLIRLNIKPFIGRVKLARLEVGHVNRLYIKLSERFARATVRQTHAVLRRALKDAVAEGLILHNVAAKTTPPTVRPPPGALEGPDAVPEDEQRPHEAWSILDPSQAKALISAEEGSRWHAMIVLALAHGMRLGELLGLRWSAVDLELGRIAVRRQLQRYRPPKGSGEEARWVLVKPKTAAGYREFTLSRGARAALQAHRARQLEERVAALAWDTEWDLVFPNVVGRPMSPQNFHRRVFKPALERAGLEGMRFHDLRHTCATLQLAQGVDVRKVSAMLGHANIGVTLKVYAHVLPREDQDAADAADAYLG